MNKVISVTFSLLFLSFLAIPHLDEKLFKLFPYKLGGHEDKIRLPIFNSKSFISGSYQERLAKYLSQNIGLRAYFIRTDNEITASLFEQTSPKTGAPVVIIKDKNLIEGTYIRSFNNQHLFNDSELNDKVSKLAKLQKYLNKNKKQLLLMITPSKAEVIKDKISSNFLHPIPSSNISKTEALRKHLTEANINFLDGPAFFQELKTKLNFPLFSNTGAHWGYYPTCLFFKAALKNVEEHMSAKLLNLNCGEPNIIRPPIGTDKDLLNTLNVWRPKRFFKDNFYSKSYVTKPENFIRLKLLIVGDSFVWQLLKYNDTHNIFSQRDYFYYFETNHSKHGIVPRGRIDKSKLNWQEILSEKDLIIIEFNQKFIDRIGFGFIEDALKFIESSPELTSR